MNDSFKPQDPNYNQVLDTWIPYDTAKIYLGAKNPPIEFMDFTTLANQEDGIKFLSCRTASDIGSTYTNITTRDNLQKPLWIESAGIRFHYPSPLAHSGQGLSEQNKMKCFCEELPFHSYVQLITDDDVRLWLKPDHMPSGFGAYGSYNLVAAENTNASCGVITNGVPHSSNRFVFLSDLLIPAQTKITMVLQFSDHGKTLLKLMRSVGVWDFDGEGGQLPGMAIIEVSLRGKMGFQNRGQYKNPGAQ